jgi:hypothetical protein
MFRTRLKNYLSDCVVTLSCDIVLSAGKLGLSFAISDEARKVLNDRLDILRALYPFITVRMAHGINELAVKLFSHKERLVDEKFLDNFRFYLEESLEKILSSGIPAVRINAFGHYNDTKREYSFRYMNKGREVRYKIIKETPCDTVYKRKFRLLAFLIVLLFFFGWAYIKTFHPASLEKFRQHWPFTQEFDDRGQDGQQPSVQKFDV